MLDWFRHLFSHEPAPHVYGGIIAGKGTKTFAPVSVTTTATQLLAYNGNRRVALISNNSAAAIYLGRDNTVTVANGMNLAAGGAITDTDSEDAWWAITASGASDTRVLEIA